MRRRSKAATPGKSRRPTSPQFPPGTNILWVDDDPRYLELIREAFDEEARLHIALAGSVKEAQRLIREPPQPHFHLIGYGMAMPITGEGFDLELVQDGLAMGKGFELWFRGQKDHPQVPLVLVTNRSLPKLRDEGLLPEGRHDQSHSKVEILPWEIVDLAARLMRNLA